MTNAIVSFVGVALVISTTGTALESVVNVSVSTTSFTPDPSFKLYVYFTRILNAVFVVNPLNVLNVTLESVWTTTLSFNNSIFVTAPTASISVMFNANVTASLEGTILIISTVGSSKGSINEL